MDLNYAAYLQLDELLSIQRPRSEPTEHDEMLFITFHQVSELWFKQLLHELDRLSGSFLEGATFRSTSTLTRIRRILKTLVSQMDIIETLTPLGFASFRDRLDRASGFQSMQFREIEFALGHKRPGALDAYPEDLPGIEQARTRLRTPSIVDDFYVFLAHHGFDIPRHLLERRVDEGTIADEAAQDKILDLYVDDRELRIVFELMTDVDETIQEWRYRHLKMVERTIGNKPGTAGSLGVDYLRSTLFKPVFPDLWDIRHRM